MPANAITMESLLADNYKASAHSLMEAIRNNDDEKALAFAVAVDTVIAEAVKRHVPLEELLN